MSDVKTPTRPAAAYEADFFAWTQDQAEKLRARGHNELDWENVAEEIESLGRSDKTAIGSNLCVVLEHLIKWRYQPDRRNDSWSDSINEHRDRIARIVEDSPSLGGLPANVLSVEYQRGRRKVLRSSGFSESQISTVCPFAIGQVLDPDFWPEPDA